jgi:hypothetical protein
MPTIAELKAALNERGIDHSKLRLKYKYERALERARDRAADRAPIPEMKMPSSGKVRAAKAEAKAELAARAHSFHAGTDADARLGSQHEALKEAVTRLLPRSAQPYYARQGERLKKHTAASYAFWPFESKFARYEPGVLVPGYGTYDGITTDKAYGDVYGVFRIGAE